MPEQQIPFYDQEQQFIYDIARDLGSNPEVQAQIAPYGLRIRDTANLNGMQLGDYFESLCRALNVAPRRINGPERDIFVYGFLTARSAINAQQGSET